MGDLLSQAFSALSNIEDTGTRDVVGLGLSLIGTICFGASLMG
jgi:hypothetical protein